MRAIRIAILDHHGKVRYLAKHLHEAGFEFADNPDRFDYELLLVDTEHPESPPIPFKNQLIRNAANRGIPVVLYPHGAMPDLDYDGMRKFSVPISAQLVHGEGHAEIYRRCGLNHRVVVVGWSYGPVGLQQGIPGGADSLLFAPIHPWADGEGILPFHKALNGIAYHEFLSHPATRKVVRMYGADAPNGVTHRVDGVEYTQSDLGPADAQIAEADAVISYGTLAYQALALGKPTAFIYPYPGHHDDRGTVEAKHFSEYREFCRYPACVGDAPLDELFQKDVSEWRDLFVGGPLDVDAVVDTLKSLRPNRAVRRALARAR